jgi:hypothetical protein
MAQKLVVVREYYACDRLAHNGRYRPFAPLLQPFVTVSNARRNAARFLAGLFHRG